MRAAICLLLAVALLASLPVSPAGAVGAVLPAGQPLTAELARALLARSLPPPEGGDGWSVTLTSPAFPIANRAASDGSMTIESAELPPGGGELVALLRVTLPAGETGRLVLRGRAEAAVEVHVPRGSIAAGATIAAEDLDAILVPRRLLPAGALLAEVEIAGHAAARRLPAGRILRASQLRPVRLVSKGDTVRVLFRRGGLELALDGTALEHGGAGDAIRILNPNGGRELRAVVSGPGEVTVGAAPGPRP
jgi:flagella basal body P-ring formation protein FlgA